MSLQKHLRFLLILLYTALALGAAVLLFPGLLPFLLGWAISCLTEPIVRFCCRKPWVHRSWVAAAVLTVLTALSAMIGFFLVRRLWFELTAVSTKIPALMSLFQDWNRTLDHLIYRWTVAVSPDFRSILQAALTRTAEQIEALLSELGSALLKGLSDSVLALPQVALFLFTTLLAGYFFLAGRPTLTTFFQRQIPARWLPRLKQTLQLLKTALGGWLRAQGILMAITFVMLGAGFLLIGVDTAILLAAGIALLDALPVLGTGTILLPWALISMLGGNLSRSIALITLYAVLWIIRSLLEPRLIASRAGLHPLAALLSLYLGFTLFGVAGMLLAPLAAVLIRQLHKSGILNLWKE